MMLVILLILRLYDRICMAISLYSKTVMMLREIMSTHALVAYGPAGKFLSNLFKCSNFVFCGTPLIPNLQEHVILASVRFQGKKCK
jgi:hypothetical protein